MDERALSSGVLVVGWVGPRKWMCDGALEGRVLRKTRKSADLLSPHEAARGSMRIIGYAHSTSNRVHRWHCSHAWWVRGADDVGNQP